MNRQATQPQPELDETSDNPYDPITWQTINQLAETIDIALDKMDVRLTMGGEPTYLAINHADAKEWSTEALGEEKFALADELLMRFKSQFAPTGLHQYTEGKWYPNEAKPRWSFNCYWRLDGEPIWKNQTLLSSEHDSREVPVHSDQKLIELIAAFLGLESNAAMPAFEDIYYGIWQKEKLLAEYYWENQKDFTIPAEQIYKMTLNTKDGKPTGYVLPLHWSMKDKHWLSSSWDFKSSKLFLIPGSGAIGLRLPLNDLPLNTLQNEYEPLPETSLFAVEATLPTWQNYKNNNLARKNNKPLPQNKNIIIPTALCTEIRNKKCYVFIPPINDIALYLEVINAIELAATALNIPVILEGCRPPKDPHIQQFNITPDPGVIEINIHPAKNWQDLTQTAEILFDETNKLGLTGYKFLYDGRQVGSGGGNHITLGSSTPAQSPFLRKPSLLQSMITFWQHHPALSYLFSGLFIGPTCQAPRIDEARHESLYELEIAFQQIPPGESQQYWLIDRLLRYLLVDVSGNNHRAEFCIDKLFSPEADYGRLGLLELRAFEMTPHWQMNLLIYLLIRGLVATFWDKPYQKKLIPWENHLHDEFLLPHFIWHDLKRVIHFLNQAGYEFDLQWFEPFFNLRFPLYGQVSYQGVDLELRMALEPWSVIGCDSQSSGTSRRVDSALERIQLKVKGLKQDNLLVTCNRIIVPLFATENPYEYIAGVRFKAWGLTSTLHPNIPIHTPLKFEIINIETMQVIGGCEYHVLPQDGKFYEKRPHHSAEAERRMKERFVSKPQIIDIEEFPHQIDNADFPYTLDLRKSPH